MERDGGASSRHSSWPEGVPRSRRNCMNEDTGEIDEDLLDSYRRQRRVEDDRILEELLEEIDRLVQEELLLLEKEATEVEESDRAANARIRRRVTQCPRRENYPKKRDANGELVLMKPVETWWYVHYVSHPNVNSKNFNRKFRKRFRLPYPKFLELVSEVKASPLFRSWVNTRDIAGRPCTPVEILVLGTMRYLGRGWSFDDLEECTAVSEETFRRFFHVFICWGSTCFYEKMVRFPRNAEEAETHRKEFAEAGFDGAVGSTDATHVGMLRCSHTLKQYHKGFKMSMPARTYNVTTNHRRRILSSTPGHPSRWNDKTLILYDDFVVGIKEGDYMSDMEYDLKFRKEDGTIGQQRYRGAWLLVDNGYLNWPCTIPPYKRPSTYSELRWSKWVESLRKDVECVFGILKGRFRLLKCGTRVHGVVATDRIWLTCCALHNFLLEADGLNEEWQNGVRSDYEGELGNGDEEDLQHRLVAATVRTDEADDSVSTVGMGSSVDALSFASTLTTLDEDRGLLDEGSSDSGMGDNVKIVSRMRAETFRQCLVEHFDILYQEGNIKWPSRTGLQVPDNVRLPPTWRHNAQADP